MKTAAVRITLVIPAQLAQAQRRRVHYVSPGTQIVQLAVNGGTPQTYQVSNGSPCSSRVDSPGDGLCEIFSVDAPIGIDTFTLTPRDARNALLSQGSAQATIVQNTANTVIITLNASPAAVAVGFSDAPPPGTAANVRVSLFPLDADGFPFVGAPGTLPPVTVTDGDGSGGTSLFIGTDATCATAAGAPASSVGATQSGKQYTPVCLHYTGGALPNGATITASISGGPSGSATFQVGSPLSAGQNGVWALGVPQSGGLALERLNANLGVITAISGASTGLQALANGLTADAAGDAYVLQSVSTTTTSATYEIRRFSSAGSGNVTPASTTQFTLAPGGDGSLRIVGPALDGNGNAYVLGIWIPGNSGPGISTPPCTIYRVPLNGATNDSSVNASTTSFSVYKYHTNADGSLILTSAIADFSDAAFDFAFEPNGNLALNRYGLDSEFPGSFVDGQTTLVSPIRNLPFDIAGFTIAADPAGNVYAGSNNGPPDRLEAVSAGSNSIHATITFRAYVLAGVPRR